MSIQGLFYAERLGNRIYVYVSVVVAYEVFCKQGPIRYE